MDTTQTLTAAPPMRRGAIQIALVPAFVALGDILIFGQTPGINLFLFAAAVSAGIVLPTMKRQSLSMAALSIGFCTVAFAPLLETPSPMAVGLAVAAIMLVALSGARLLPAHPTRVPPVLLRFALVLPLRLVRDLQAYRTRHTDRSSPVKIWRSIGVWLMPLVLASVFLALFAAANPLIEVALRSIRFAVLLQFFDLWRIDLWAVIAVFVWALLRPRLKRRVKAGSAQTIQPLDNALLGHAFLLRCLTLFNALFAVQTVLDLVYLWGGANLPDHMSHAEYAHRGAYPLIATALLAAAFVLLTMRRDGPGDTSPLIRRLVYAWIAQNILLCLSSILRLDLYVEAYSLTELRVAAGIWMGLVATGLVLILLRILLGRSNQWLVATNLASLVAVLYISALVDFQGLIARFNVSHSVEIDHQGVALDLDYLSSLGPSAIPALDFYIAALPNPALAKMYRAKAIREGLASEFWWRPQDWRSWTFRSARLAAYLRSVSPIARYGQNDNNRDILSTQDK